MVKKVLKQCVLCKMFQGKTMIPPPSPDLPGFRVNYLTNAFEATGLDYAGPLLIKELESSKVYILLFTCISSRVIHLELTPDMKSPAFIRAFQRFVSRRGKPSMIISDNFKTFKSSDVKSFMLKNEVRQEFILPASPWWGGFYERLVRSVKLCLRKILKKSFLSYEELETILCQIEDVINQRPLCYISDDDLGNVITPNHLIFGRPLCSDMPAHKTNLRELTPETCVKRVQHQQKLVNDFWKRFSNTYLNEIRQRHLYTNKKTAADSQLEINDVVLIKDDIPLPRAQWKIGKVERLVLEEMERFVEQD